MRVLFWMSMSFDRRTRSEHLLTAIIEALYQKGHTVHILQKDTSGPLPQLPETLQKLGVTTTCVQVSLPKKSNFIASFKLPSFMRDWVIKRFQDDEGNIDTDSAGDFIKEFIPKKDDWKSILNRVVNFHDTVKFLGKISVNIQL